MSIVQGLFGDMLPPQMLDGGGGMQPVMQPPVQPAVQPVMQPVMQPPVAPAPVKATPVANQKAVAPVQVPEEPIYYAPEGPIYSGPSLDELQGNVPASPQKIIPPNLATLTQQESFVDPNQMDLSGFEGLDFANLNFDGLGDLPSFQMPQQQSATDYFNQSMEFLGGVASGDSAKKVNRRDDIYNDYFGQTGYRYQGDPANFRAEVGLSDNFAVYDNPDSTITGDSVQNAYNLLSSAEDPVAALSEYYGFDIAPTVNEGANYKNAHKYGTTTENMAQFQSLVEPILQRSIPYIQATQGLNYTDALEYAYTHDPMVAALYNNFGVDLYRSTKDGSTYIYDPIAGQEIRTLEVKDAKFKDYLPAIAGIALSFTGVPAALGGMFGASGATASAIGQGLVSASTAALGGARGSDVFKAGVLGAAGGYVKGLQTTAAELGKAAEAATAAGDVAKAADLTAQASTATSQFELMSTIQNTARAADAIANKDYVGAVLIGLDEAGFSLKDWTANKLSGLAGSGEILGMNADDLAVGVNKFAVKMLEGADPEAALRSAVVEYAKAGGSFPDLGIDLPDIDFDLPDFDGLVFFDSVKNSKIVQTIRDFGREVDNKVLEPVKEGIESAGRSIDENVVQPTREALKDIDIPHPDFDFNMPDMGELNLGGGGSGGMLGGSVGGGQLASKYVGKGLNFNPQLLTSAVPQGQQQDYLAQLLAGKA